MSCCVNENIMDIIRKRGEIKDIEFRLRYEDGTPFDFTGATFEGLVKTTTDTLVAVLNVYSPDLENGRITVETGDTSTWKVGKHKWDMKVSMPDGKVFYIPSSGVARFTIEPSVSV